MHRRCCWPPESSNACFLSCFLTSPQSAARVERLLDEVVELGALADALRARAVDDVLVDRHRERVRALEHHAHAHAQVDRVHLARVDVDPVEQDLAAHGHVAELVVHAVQAAQERGLAAPRRADERGHGLRRDVHVHAGERRLLAVRDRDVAEVEGAGRVRLRGGRGVYHRILLLCRVRQAAASTPRCHAGDKYECRAPHDGRCGLHGLGCHDVEVVRERHDRRERRLGHRREERGRREDDRRRLARGARQPQDRAGHDAGRRRRKHDAQRRPQLRRAERQRRLSQVLRHLPQRLLGGRR